MTALRRYPKRGGQFAIIWVDLLYEDSVPATAKILYGEIYRLSNADGWCDASNEEFCDLLGCSENTVRNLSTPNFLRGVPLKIWRGCPQKLVTILILRVIVK